MAGPTVTRITDQALSDRIVHGHSGHWHADGVNEIGGRADQRMPDSMTLETGEHEVYLRSFNADGTPGDIKQMVSTPDGMQYQPWDATAHPGIDRKFDVALNEFQQQAAQLPRPAPKQDVAPPPAPAPPVVAVDRPSPAKIAKTIAGGNIHINYGPGSRRLGHRDEAQIDRMALKIEHTLAAHHGQGTVNIQLEGMADAAGFKGNDATANRANNQELADARVDGIEARLKEKLKADGVSADHVNIVKGTELGKQRMAKGTLSFTS